MILVTNSYTLVQTFNHNSSGTLSDLIPWIYLLLPLYNHKGFSLGHTEGPTGFPKPWISQWGVHDLSHSQCLVFFCWLYRASPSSTGKNIISLISVLTIWWYTHVESSLVLLKGLALGKTVRPCPTSFCTPRKNLPVTLGISWLPTFAFQSPVMKRTSLFGVSSRSLMGLLRTT